MTEETHTMTTDNAQPELKQVLGALLFAARKPIAADELRATLAQVTQNGENAVHTFDKIQESDIRTALEQLKAEFAERKQGIILVDAPGGLRFQTDPAAGPWVRQLLNLDKPARLSKPALETLAIIAYRQPATRAEIEALRGVNVDAMMRHLMELQLIRIVGRSDLPGRPLMYGTTQLFLEHFGLSSVKNLPGVEQLSRRDAERAKRSAETKQPTTADGQPAAVPTEGEGAKTEPPKTEEANAELPLSNASAPERLEEQATQLPTEEQTEDDVTNKADAASEKVADQDQTEETEEEEEEEEEYDEEDDDDEDDDEDEDKEC